MAPPVVLLSHSENPDLSSTAAHYVTQRSTDGGRTFTTLGSAVPMSTATQRATARWSRSTSGCRC
jgi:hypothetical protein